MKRFWYLVGLIVLLLAVEAWAQPGPRPEQLNPAWEHDKWGTLPKDHVWHFRAYTTSFDGPDDNDGDGEPDLWGIPEWVSYELKRGPNRSELGDRPGWHTVPEWYQEGIAPMDESYEGSGYSRGHMCMRSHAGRLGTNADFNSHSVVNACPQKQGFNNGIWKGLENKVSHWADQYGSVWTICGPIVLNRSRYARPSEWIGDPGEMKVAVPQWFFKIVVKESGNPHRPDVLAFIYPHDERLSSSSQTVDHRPYLYSVRTIEEATGLDFFTVLSKSDQDAIETNVATALWPEAPDTRKSTLATAMDQEGRSDVEVGTRRAGPLYRFSCRRRCRHLFHLRR